jgi:hypothetical protein
LTALATVGELRSLLGNGVTPVLWYPASPGMRCASCGYSEEKWEAVRTLECPRCGAWIRPRTVLELNEAPPDTRLIDLGVPDREILPVRGPEGWSYVELRPWGERTRT